MQNDLDIQGYCPFCCRRRLLTGGPFQLEVDAGKYYGSHVKYLLSGFEVNVLRK